MVSVSVITGSSQCSLRHRCVRDYVYLVNDTNYTLEVLLNVASPFPPAAA